MNLPALCIHRPVMTTLLTAALILFGAAAYRLLPVSDLPNIDFPTIVVSANLPGATPETMASAVATPLEQQLSTIAGIDSMSSTSTLGSTQITLQFALKRNIDAAAQDVQAAIAAVQRRLPTDMPSPPSFRKTNPADQPVMFLTLSSPTVPLSTINDYAEITVAQRLSTLDGVSQVNINGSQKYALRVRLDPRLLAARGVGLDEVRAALATQNVKQPTGQLDGDKQAFTVVSDGQLENIEQFRQIVVAYRNGAPLRLGELAEVIDSVQERRGASTFYENGRGVRSISISIQKQPGSNTVEVVDRVRALIPEIRQALPESIYFTELRNSADAVRESLHDVQLTLLFSIVLVVFVIFVFLRSAAATAIPSVAIPLALLGTFIVMYFFGYTLDNLSLLALTLSVGFVVDDAIVMLENIVRHQEKGLGVREASLVGSREVGFTILSMTVSLVAVFIPLMFMGGILGRLLHEFAVTISAAILISGLVSVTLTPMLCSRFLKPVAAHAHAAPGRFFRWTERGFDAMLAFYRRTLAWSLRFRRTTLAVAALMVVLTFIFGALLKKGFIPTDDTNLIQIQIEGAQDVSFDEMVRHQQVAAQIVANHPAVAKLQSNVGVVGGGGASVNRGNMNVRLKPRSERISAFEVVNQLRVQLAGIPGIRCYPLVPPAHPSRRTTNPRSLPSLLLRLRPGKTLRRGPRHGAQIPRPRPAGGRELRPPDHQPAGARGHPARPRRRPRHLPRAD
jgi:multidrug efflux pump subunit AcrB